MLTIKDTPDIYDEDKWAAECKPIPNNYRPGMGFDYGDGCCLFLNTDLQNYIREHNVSDDQIWSIIESENELYLTHGWSFVNNIGYIVTENAPRFTPTEDILLE